MMSWACRCRRPWDAPARTACSLVWNRVAFPLATETIQPSPPLAGATVMRCRAGIIVSFPGEALPRKRVPRNLSLGRFGKPGYCADYKVLTTRAAVGALWCSANGHDAGVSD